MAGGQNTSGGIVQKGDRRGGGTGPTCSAPLGRFEPIFPPRRRVGYNRGMLIVLGFLGVAFAAFVVWLAVRIINRRERWAKWTLAAVVLLPVLYVASFGPACWIASRMNADAILLSAIYSPLVDTYCYTDDELLCGAFEWYSTIGAADGWRWYMTRLGEGDYNLVWRH
jgi:hypothetical protein